MGMYDRDWYREERRQQRQQQQSSDLQPQPERAQRVGPPDLMTAPAILAVFSAIAVVLLILSTL